MKILKGDSLFVILILPRTLLRHKVVKKISYFYIIFIVATAIGDFSVVAITNQWHLAYTRYIGLVGGLFVVQLKIISLWQKFYYPVLGIKHLLSSVYFQLQVLEYL